MMEDEIESAKRIYDVLNSALNENKAKYESSLTTKNELIFKLEENNKDLERDKQELQKKLDAFKTALQGVSSDE